MLKLLASCMEGSAASRVPEHLRVRAQFYSPSGRNISAGFRSRAGANQIPKRRCRIASREGRAAITKRLISSRIEKARLRELLFRISVILKGLDGAAELAGGIALWVVSPVFIVRAVHWLTAGEISEDPHDLVANFLRREAARFSLSGEHFIAIYLLIHGVIKIGIVVALLRDALWAYPTAMIIFLGFIAYQTYQYALTGGIGLIALSVFDAAVIALVWLEYRALKSNHHTTGA